MSELCVLCEELVRPLQHGVIVESAIEGNIEPVKPAHDESAMTSKSIAVTKKDELLASLPPPTPVHTKKIDLCKDASVFKKIDDNARNTPETVRMSVDKLVAHLCKVATTDLEKLRAFYFWICNNIRQDGAKPVRTDAVSTLRQGRGSYVNLMEAFCKEVSIPVVIIHGCAKGQYHQPDKEYTLRECNHSWNAVHINGEWRFLDCTWGSVGVDGKGKFNNHFKENWFITDPEKFAYDHLPADPAWQLLDVPIDIDDFNKTPIMTMKSLELGIKLISHQNPIINVQKEESILFGVETLSLSNITTNFLTTDGTKLNNHRCIRRLDDKMFEVRVVPPQTGEYVLQVYGRAKNYIHAKYKMLVEYMLQVETVFQEKIEFPNHFEAWGPEPNYAEYGFSDSIEKQSVFKAEANEMTISLEQTRINQIYPKLMHATDCDKELKDFTMVTANENGSVVHCRFPTSGYYKLDIYAAGPNTEKLVGCASFLIECTVSDKPAIYPKYSCASVSKYQCELLEPMFRELPSSSIVTFRMRSTGLREAMVGITTEEKHDDSRIESIGEIHLAGDVFSGNIQTPEKGHKLTFSGSADSPTVFWESVYKFVTV